MVVNYLLFKNVLVLEFNLMSLSALITKFLTTLTDINVLLPNSPMKFPYA